MMKLSATQKEIEGLAKRVPQLTDKQKEWARKNFNYFKIVLQGTTHTWCPECKREMPIYPSEKGARWNKNDNVVTCPHCGTKTQVRIYPSSDETRTPRFRNHQEDFFQVMNVVGDWQVTRLIYMDRYCYLRKPSSDWAYYEVCQAWNNPKYSTTYFRAFPKKGFGSQYRFNPYKLYEWSIRLDEDGHYAKDANGYFIWEPIVGSVLEPRRAGGANYFETHSICPGAHVLPQYKQMGLTAEYLRKEIRGSAINWFELFSGKNYKPMWETLIKAKEYKLITEIGQRSWRKADDRYFSAWKIAKRHHYKVKDISEWLDLLDLLDDAKMDCRNPRYICPANVHELHQKLLTKREKDAERKKDMERLKEAMKYSKEYAKRIAKYLDMDIHDDTLHIAVLPNVKAFKDEADHLCHCVFRCRYYLHTDSLILSARDATGKRWETIEVSLRDFTIVQAYGYGDEHTEKHDEILNLVESNMWQIKQRYAKAS